MSTKIEWTRGDDGSLGETWNPVRGCTRVSEGCRNCYAEKVAARFHGDGRAYHGLTSIHPSGERRWNGEIRLLPEKLDQPLRWRKPRRIFVNSMSDLFHESVPDEFIDRVFAVMALARWHTFQLLTKRPERMREYCASLRFERLVECCNRNAYGEPHKIEAYSLASIHHRTAKSRDRLYGRHDAIAALPKPPLPNVHVGVSVEDQKTADERIPLLLETPAAVRFVSAEPLLAEVLPREAWLLGAWIECPIDGRRELGVESDAEDPCAGCPGFGDECGAVRGPRLDWLIVGGESGPRARACDVAWIRSIVEQCRAAGVPAFCKQLGARPYDSHGNGEECCTLRLRDRKGGDMEEFPEDLRVREFPR